MPLCCSVAQYSPTQKASLKPKAVASVTSRGARAEGESGYAAEASPRSPRGRRPHLRCFHSLAGAWNAPPLQCCPIQPYDARAEGRLTARATLIKWHMGNADLFRLARRELFLRWRLDSSVLPRLKKSEATPPNGINQRFPLFYLNGVYFRPRSGIRVIQRLGKSSRQAERPLVCRLNAVNKSLFLRIQ